MAKIKYYYDTESCRYERIKVSSWDIIINLMGFLVVSSIIGLGIFFVTDHYFESPAKASLRKENEELKLYYELLEKDLNEANRMLSVLEERDDDIYRVVFGVEPIPDEIRSAGVGGANRYRDLLEQGLKREELILTNMQRIDKLKKQMYIQTKSYDEIVDMAKNKEALLASLPAIQPLSNKELKRLSSGFGYRIDPIYKTKRMHPGTDFSVKVGTPVYATGDGVVKFTRTRFSGYGKQIEINHGFGYVTKYAHLSEFAVKAGQKVKRGQIIAYSGNTGKSTAPHLHYEVIKDGKKVNPVNYFYRDLTDEEYAEILRLSSIENQAMGSY
ncbi:Peptidase family M23 [Ekhidna lutea]|uniref:Peptidase family M23 n=1 Tax=Ekhidna lutea TaxID=447679 RepID=A0A239M898_EKHLU|nr:M23 family metallopeptidase [Ekhidna lutea]SNT38975.1 Peptidase family M23 [Ekhidna lutea]